MKEDVSQLEQAVLCAFQYAGAQEASQQAVGRDAEQFCRNVQQQPNGAQLALTLLETSTYDQAKFFALQTLQERLMYNSPYATSDAAVNIRSRVMEWLQKQLPTLDAQPSFLKTKEAVVLTRLIRRDYPQAWPQAFSDLLSLIPAGGSSMVELYFRVLIAIHEEIVEYNEQRGQDQAARNMQIKDAMRESTCMQETFDTIYNVLCNWKSSDTMAELSSSALETLKCYISWVDLGLVVNDKLLPLLFDILKQDDGQLRCLAANCMFEIVDKGMSAEKKVLLIRDLQILPLLPSLLAQDDDDFSEELGEIVNAIGLELVQAIDHFRNTNQPELLDASRDMLTVLMPLVWRIFSHENKDVSEEVFEIVDAIGTLIRSENSMSPDDPSLARFSAMQYLPQILHGIYRQTRYPEEDAGSDEAEFESYRRSLYKIFVNLSRVRPNDLLTFLTNLGQEVLSNFDQWSARDLESYLSLVFKFKEGLSALKGNANVYEEPNGELYRMVASIHTKMIETCASKVLHSSVLLTYYDLAVRYARVLQHNTELVPGLLNLMFGNNGLVHSDAHVRSRVCYLCLRLVKTVGSSAIHPHVNILLQSLQPRLSIPEDMSVAGIAERRAQDPYFLPFDDQLYLFELAGQVVTSVVPNNNIEGQSTSEMMELKYHYTKAVLEPLLHALETSVTAVNNGNASMDIVVARVTCILSATAHVMKAFKTTTTINHQQELFTQVLTATSFVTRVFAAYASVRSKAVFMLHRLIPVLENDQLLANVPDTLRHLMVQCESGDVVEVVQLLDQLILKHKQDLFPFFDEVAVPFIQRLYALLPSSTVSTQSETKDAALLERESIQKYMFAFLHHLVTHQLDRVLVSERNGGQLESLLRLTLDGCTNVAEPTVNRGCFSIAHELVARWVLGANDGSTQVLSGIAGGESPLPEASRQQFLQMVVQDFTAAAFTLSKCRHFQTYDAQCGQTIKDIAIMMLVLTQAMGDEYLRYVQQGVLPSVGCSPEAATTFADSLRSGDRKIVMDAYKWVVQQF